MESSKEIQQLFIDDVRSKAMYTGKRATGSARVMFASNLYIPKEESRMSEMEAKSIWLRWPEFNKKPKHEQHNLLKLWLHEYKYSPMEIANSLHCKLSIISGLIKFHKIGPAAKINPAPAPVEDIFKPIPDMSYEDFKLLPDAERIAKYDEYKAHLGTERALAEAWKLQTLIVSNIMSGTRKRVKNGVERNDSFNKHRKFTKFEEEKNVQEQPKKVTVDELITQLRDNLPQILEELNRLQEVEKKYKKIREALAEV